VKTSEADGLSEDSSVSTILLFAIGVFVRLPLVLKCGSNPLLEAQL
jgi:hypothetical protein